MHYISSAALLFLIVGLPCDERETIQCKEFVIPKEKEKAAVEQPVVSQSPLSHVQTWQVPPSVTLVFVEGCGGGGGGGGGAGGYRGENVLNLQAGGGGGGGAPWFQHFLTVTPGQEIEVVIGGGGPGGPGANVVTATPEIDGGAGVGGVSSEFGPLVFPGGLGAPLNPAAKLPVLGKDNKAVFGRGAPHKDVDGIIWAGGGDGGSSEQQGRLINYPTHGKGSNWYPSDGGFSGDGKLGSGGGGGSGRVRGSQGGTRDKNKNPRHGDPGAAGTCTGGGGGAGSEERNGGNGGRGGSGYLRVSWINPKLLDEFARNTLTTEAQKLFNDEEKAALKKNIEESIKTDISLEFEKRLSTLEEDLKVLQMRVNAQPNQ